MGGGCQVETMVKYWNCRGKDCGVWLLPPGGTLIYENTKSIERQRYKRKLAEFEESLRPPCVLAPEY
ncbi:hypothetical protein PHMEG_00021224 [Phytophthora megakarya]|uniref:Uncharacterized protein n=1 Tax=Phytophthora megakarya TaxID=4795 RepID=A0A225VPN7_9STRA|nr:hypothetical protein PHMEG_00021224 [Phytophthora megakarya]